MSRLLPIRPSVSLRPDREPRLVEIADDAADEVFEALSSKTARTIFTSLHESPATASDLAETADTSLQNVRYHLDKLAEAGLIEITDTWYSDRGREMKVYTPANTSLVMMSGDGPPETTLRNLLKNLVGGIGVLGLASVLFGRVVNELAPSDERVVSTSANQSTTVTPTAGQPTATVEGDGGAASPTPRVKTEVVERTVGREVEVTPTPNGTETPTSAAGFDGGGVVIEVLGIGVPPGVIFFIGGLFVLLLATGWYYRRMRRYPA